MYLWILILFFIFGASMGQNGIQNFYIGAIFNSNNKEQELAFKRGIEEANRILTDEWNMKQDATRFQFRPLLMNFNELNSFEASQKACSLLEKQIIAIIGPTDPVAADQIEAVCQQFGIPFLDLSPSSLQLTQRRLSINLYPHHSSITDCVMEYINSMTKWMSLVILYTESEDLIKFSDFLNKFDKHVLLKVITFDGSEKYLMKYLESNRHFHFIVDIPYWHFTKFMKLADSYNMTTQYYSYLFTNWDTQLLNLENLTLNTAANITTLALVPMEDQNSKDKAMVKLQKDVSESQKLKHNVEIFTFLTTETAMIYDSMRLLAKGFLKVAHSNVITLSTGVTCSSMSFWMVGVSYLNAIKSVPIKSMSGNNGNITVDENGWRDNFQISIRRINNRSYFENYGYWSKSTGLKITKAPLSEKSLNLEISKQTLRVTTIIDEPFVISKYRDANGKTPKNPDAWDGFCIRLIKRIAQELNFSFTIEEVTDRNYGSEVLQDGIKKWDGLVGELMYHKADLAVSSLTITYDRERVIDFTTPFMNLGISIIFARPEPKAISLFSFLEPLSVPVWGYVIASYISVSFVLFVIGRFSPYEWYNPSPCDPNPKYDSNKFNILNSMWFTIGSFMQQGTDIVPKATSTRVVAGMWWFFVLIIISSYTANLAAFLTVARMNVPIENADDLSKQVKIQYGTVKGGSTYQFFQKSKLGTYQKMYKYMSTHSRVMVKDNKEGIEKVKSASYAFILESTTNEFYTQRQCNLVRIGGLLDSKGYGIGLPQGSRYRDVISEAILKLQKAQEIENQRRYFWREYNVTKQCEAPQPSSTTSSLGIDEVGGVFVMLSCGAVLSIIVAVFELFYKAWKKSKVNKTGVCSEVHLILHQNSKACCGDDEESHNHNGSNSSSPINFPPVVTSDICRNFTVDVENNNDPLNHQPDKVVKHLPYDFGVRSSSPLYHLPPATKIQPLNINSIPTTNNKMIFKDSHAKISQQPSFDNSSSQVRMKKVAC